MNSKFFSNKFLQAVYLPHGVTGSGWHDDSGHNHLGVLNAPAIPRFRRGSQGRTINFVRATNTYVALGTRLNNHAGIISIEAVVTFDVAPTNIGQIISADADGGVADRNFQFRRDATGELNFVVFDSDGVVQAISVTQMAAGVTYYVVGVTDGAEARVYINGKQEGTTPATGPMNTNAIVWDIGRETRGSPGDFIDGHIDLLAIHFGVLPAAEIRHRAVDPFAPYRRARRVIVKAPVGELSGTATLATSGDINASALVTKAGGATLVATGDVTANASGITGQSTLVATGDITQAFATKSGGVSHEGTATLTTTGDITDASALITKAGGATLATTGDANASALVTKAGGATLVTTGDVNASALVTKAGSVTLSAIGDITDASALITKAGGATLATTGDVNANASGISGQSTLTTTGDVTQAFATVVLPGTTGADVIAFDLELNQTLDWNGAVANNMSIEGAVAVNLAFEGAR